MAVLPMKRISICALKKDRKKILGELQRKEILELTNTKSKYKIFYKEETIQKTECLRRQIQTSENALEILNHYVPEKRALLASLEGRKEIEAQQYDSFAAIRDQIYEHAEEILTLSKDITDSKSEQQKIELMETSLLPWKDLDIPMSEPGTKTTSLIIGTMPGTWDEAKIKALFKDWGDFDLHIISIQDEFTCIVILVLKKQFEHTYETLRANGFARPVINSSLAPKDQLEVYKEETEMLMQRMAEAEDKIVQLADHREQLKFLIDYDTIRNDQYEQIQNLLQSKHTFILSGYVAAQNAERLADEIESRYVAEVEIMEPKKKEDVPVLLKNNGFASPLESVTVGFGAPSKKEMDPTFAMSIFYYMLFGIMFSDAGYGLVLALMCGIVLHRYQHMEEGTKEFLKMFLFCGIATAFWGFIFGSFFGDAVGVIAKSFFHSDLTLKPIWFSPNDKPMKMLVFAMTLGLIHLMAGLVMKFINCIRNKQYQDAVYDSVLWIVLVLSCVALLMSVQTFIDIIGIPKIKLSASAGKTAGVVAGIAALGIVLTSGRESKNWFKRLLKGIYGVYGITGYLSDVLSYSRLLALGLATGVIGSVVNSMGVMSENVIVRTIMFIIIFLIGHLLNFLINILGAYVHTNRLQYVEFFGKFYDGGGHVFRPFSSKTKYFIVKEKEHE